MIYTLTWPRTRRHNRQLYFIRFGSLGDVTKVHGRSICDNSTTSCYPANEQRIHSRYETKAPVSHRYSAHTHWFDKGLVFGCWWCAQLSYPCIGCAQCCTGMSPITRFTQNHHSNFLRHLFSISWLQRDLPILPCYNQWTTSCSLRLFYPLVRLSMWRLMSLGAA